jgi:hypothetical protein
MNLLRAQLAKPLARKMLHCRQQNSGALAICSCRRYFAIVRMNLIKSVSWESVSLPA